MDWDEHEKDELLVRYLDRELSSTEIERFEQLLGTDPELRQKLADWQSLDEKLGELRSQNPTGRQLDASFADRVIQGAQARVRDQDDPNLAPWIAREPATIDAAGRLQTRDGDFSDPISENGNRPSKQRWIVRGSLMAVAASLLAVIVLNLPSSNPNALLSPGPELTQERKSASDQPSSLEIVLDDKNKPTVTIESPSLPDDRSVASTVSAGTSNSPSLEATTSAVPDQRGARSEANIQLSNTLAETMPAQNGIKEAASFSVAPDLSPSPQQLKMLEDMMANPNGMFLMVVDVQLPDGVTDLDALRGILDRHDIAWASELDIDDSIQSTLAKSRMIAEAGKQGLIPDYVAPDGERAKSQDKVSNEDFVSLVFVKARGSRLDAALVEVMRQTDEFPVFSFDLAFDPPTHDLMNELRFIQEAKLPASNNQQDRENVSNVIQRTRGAYFAAGPRRTAAMELGARRQGRPPLDAETMNPISYALFIVRHAAPNSSR